MRRVSVPGGEDSSHDEKPVTVERAMAISTGAWWCVHLRMTQSAGMERRS